MWGYKRLGNINARRVVSLARFLKIFQGFWGVPRPIRVLSLMGFAHKVPKLRGLTSVVRFPPTFSVSPSCETICVGSEKSFAGAKMTRASAVTLLGTVGLGFFTPPRAKSSMFFTGRIARKETPVCLDY